MFSLYKVSDATKREQRELAQRNQTDRLFYCYRCYDCGRLITKLEILEGREARRSNICPCGSRKMKPTNALISEELFLPRCWKLIIAIRFSRIAPMPSSISVTEQAEADRMNRASIRAFEARQKISV